MYPFVDFFGRPIPTYGLCMAVAIVLVGALAARYAVKAGIAWEDIMIIGAVSVMSGLLCGYLLYLGVTYTFSDIFSMLQRGDYSFLRGGLVFYGALIGGVLGGLLSVRLTHSSLTLIERCIVPYIPFGHAIGRVGCFFGGCCHGMPYDGIFAVYYPNPLFDLNPRQGYFPVQLLEALVLVGIGLLLLWYRKKNRKKPEILCAYLGLYGFARFFLEFLRGDAIRGFAGGVSTSQWISLVLFCGWLMYYLLLRPKSKARKKEKSSQRI